MVNDSFLSSVAKNISKHYNNDFQNLNIIFTNKRAKVFFNEVLYEHLQKPFFSPNYYTINDFVGKYSQLVEAQELILIYYLYEVYSEVYYRDKPDVEKESFEHFYFWGQTILRDFDDIDKNLASAQQVFTNIENYKDLENKFEFLSDEQKELLNGFFEGCFKLDASSQIKQRFIYVWNCLLEIYNKYKEKLKALGVGYSGMLYRDLVERLKESDKIGDGSYCIIGFNVLNNVEKGVFSWLKSNYETRFYWDYDDYYNDNPSQEAGLFIRENLKIFPNPEDFSIDTNLILKKSQELEIISTTNENSQVGYINNWLESLVEKDKNLKQSDIAIVLCNEDLLPSVLSALPEKIGKEKTMVNITMGYKFVATSLYSLIDHYLKLQSSLSRKNNLRLIHILPFAQHTYFNGAYNKIIAKLIDNNAISLNKEEIESFGDLSHLLKPQISPQELLSSIEEIIRIIVKTNIKTEKDSKGNNGIEEVLSETIYRLSGVINNLKDLFQNNNITIEGNLLYQTIRQQLSSIMIPFEGDPINGVQIMGLLETRSLDFKHILFLSTNDDVLPNVSQDNSFIPFTIRKAYNLTTIERKIAVFAYYFYRLFHHSSSIHFLYNANTTDVKPKEMSRFLQQLRIESGKPFSYKTLISNIKASIEPKIAVEKKEEYFNNVLNKSQERFLSPTYINDYLNCQLKFFFKHIYNLETIEDFEEELQDNVFGTIFHDSAKEFYNNIIKAKKDKGLSDIESRKINESDIEEQKKHIDSIVKNNYEKVFLKKAYRTLPDIEYNQISKIKLTILSKYMHQLVKLDKAYAPFYIIALEEKFIKPIMVEGKSINIGGYIDRIDYKINDKGEKVIRVLDYKTNDKKKEAVHFNEVFFYDGDNPKRNDYILQAFVYSWLIYNNTAFDKMLNGLSYDIISPEILYIKQSIIEGYTSQIALKSDEDSKKQVIVDNFLEYEKDFEDKLKHCIKDMITNTKNTHYQQQMHNCTYCDFSSICL
ncbi:MAG: PD-(D/E)XK nuclease family protein [Bacteroidales bacterium]|nr:PD-(D/E)XK nuclease family protein [Bacteroidales bacterium]MDD4684359.1 PD-(D/E)XK nuclease family protein [Bacteroidales bacterium]